MEFGVFDHLDQGGAALAEHYENRLRLIDYCDRSGFYAYHIAEHHGTPLGAAPSPGIFLASVAQRTRRLRFGPLVYLLPLYEPLRLIEEICMLDQLGHGRLELGVGRGISPHELALYGMTSEAAQARFTEALSVVLSGLESPVLNFRGDFYSYQDVPLPLRPFQTPHPPLWYGALRPETAEWAAGRRMNIVIGNGPAAEVRAVAERYWSCSAPSFGTEPKIGIMRQIVLADSDAEARASARRAYRSWRDSFTYLWRLRGDGFADSLVPSDFDSLEARGEAVAGSVDKVLSVLRKDLVETRTNYLVCRFAFGDLTIEETLRSAALFAEHVMPVLRSSVRA